MSEPRPAASPGKRLRQPQASIILPLVCLIVLGANLRPALSSVAPVLTAIQRDLHISYAATGILTTLPVLCFGLFAPGAAHLATRFTVDRVILSGLLVLVAGLCLRIFFGAPGLFLGTLLAGAGIGAVMVLLPPVIKRDFPGLTGLMTGIYTMTLCLGASLAAGVTVPIQKYAAGDWRPALAVWALPAALAAWVWVFRMRRLPYGDAARRERAAGIYGHSLAWQVTLYMGLQSSIAFIVFGWLPAILIDRGMAPVICGYAMSVVYACQIPTSLAAPALAARNRDQRFACCLYLGIAVAGLLGCLYAPFGGIWLWAVVLGLGMGGTFSLALALIVWRSPDPETAASLSGMAQGIGYIIAALGPFAVGVLHQWTGGWAFLGWFLALIATADLLSALGAGRNAYIKLPPVQPRLKP